MVLLSVNLERKRKKDEYNSLYFQLLEFLYFSTELCVIIVLELMDYVAILFLRPKIGRKVQSHNISISMIYEIVNFLFSCYLFFLL